MKKLQKGFTLIELLVVIGILAILLAITLIAINPSRQFGQSNNTKRRSDILQILNSVHQYAAENGGQLPADMPAQGAAAETIGSNGVDNAGFANLCATIVPNYMPALPMDPSEPNAANITACAAAHDTGYTIARDAQDRITVAAPGADLGVTINVTR